MVLSNINVAVVHSSRPLTVTGAYAAMLNPEYFWKLSSSISGVSHMLMKVGINIASGIKQRVGIYL